jgi:superfamily I DNA and/or RNA helicase
MTLNVFTFNISVGLDFDILLIDEASQALEAESLIATRKSLGRLILAGDHNQLPPTIQSKGEVEKILERTMFERVMELHPEVVSFVDAFRGSATEVKRPPDLLCLLILRVMT